MRKLEKGDTVEVVANNSERGMKGVVTSTSSSYCYVRITKSGESYSTVAMIGKTKCYKITDVRII